MKHYLTRGEFIQALKDIPELREKIAYYKVQINHSKYLRYSKVKSPLDYDVVGYEDGEPIRQIKTRNYVSEGQRNEQNRGLDKEIEEYISKKELCENRLKNALYELKKIKSPLKEIIEDKYINGMTYKDIIEKYPKVFSGVAQENYVLRYIVAKLDMYFDE